MSKHRSQLSLTCYSDVLCIWAHIAQARIDEVARKFPEQVRIEHQFCTIFGDTAHKIETGWHDRGGYEGFGQHVLESAQAYPHIKIHPNIWKQCRPLSSTPAHLFLKAVQRVDSLLCEQVLKDIRSAFFEHCRDIAEHAVLHDIVRQAGLSVNNVQAVIDSGLAYADLEADRRMQGQLLVQGSPTFILNEGRQKLYGNVGYSVIEANIKELIRTPNAGAASWC